MTELRDRIAAVLVGACPCFDCTAVALEKADAVIEALEPIPDRTFMDDQGRTWEWCGGQPGTWAWRITDLGIAHA